MKNKFKMELTWHNCQTHPPSEDYNSNLIATDGVNVFKVKYDKLTGWMNMTDIKRLPFDMLYDYWWADVEQTVRECSDFMED